MCRAALPWLGGTGRRPGDPRRPGGGEGREPSHAQRWRNWQFQRKRSYVQIYQFSTPRLKGQTMPTLNFRIVEITAGSLFSFEINHEGMFLFIYPFELALLWPWTKL